MTLPRRAEAPPSGIPSWARVGAKVVCIRWTDADMLTASHFSIAPLAEGAVYTVREAIMRPAGPALLLVEITNEIGHWFDFEMAYDIDRFRRPIRKLLTGQPVRKSERA